MLNLQNILLNIDHKIEDHSMVIKLVRFNNNNSKTNLKTTRMTYYDENKLLDVPSNQLQAKTLSRMRIKDDIDPILINLSNLETIYPKKSQMDVRNLFQSQRNVVSFFKTHWLQGFIANSTLSSKNNRLFLL